MLEPRYDSPLTGRLAPENLAVHVREIPERGMFDLRGLSSDRKFMAAAKGVLSLDLPKAPRASASWGEVKALWLSIDQWLILCPRPRKDELIAALRSGLEGSFSAVTDVSDMRAVIRVEGEGARGLLMKGTSLDLLSPDYEVGACRRMLFANIAALLHIVSAKPDVIDVYVFRSHADYAWDWLLAAGRASAALRLFGSQAAPNCV